MMFANNNNYETNDDTLLSFQLVDICIDWCHCVCVYVCKNVDLAYSYTSSTSQNMRTLWHMCDFLATTAFRYIGRKRKRGRKNAHVYIAQYVEQAIVNANTRIE